MMMVSSLSQKVKEVVEKITETKIEEEVVAKIGMKIIMQTKKITNKMKIREEVVINHNITTKQIEEIQVNAQI